MICGQILTSHWNPRRFRTGSGLLIHSMKDWVQAFEQPMASRIISFTTTWRWGNEDPSCTKLKSCKNLIFSQYRVMVFVVKHLSFSQYGRVRSSPTMWPKFLSPAFHNLWIFSVVERYPFSTFSNLEKQVAEFHFDQHSPRTPLIFG